VRTNSSGASWSNGTTAGTSLGIDTFYIAKAGATADTIDAALAAGKNVLFTPGVFHLSHPLHVNRADTVILGLGMATLLPDNGVVAMQVADVDGVKIAGLLFDAGPQSSPVLLEVGPSGSSADHSANPTTLSDLFFRVGGSALGKAAVSLRINSHHVIGDHFWIWRGDHSYGVGWWDNTAANGLVENCNDVTEYGLFVEHYQQYQTLWNGNRGRVYFYQSEIPYDVPSQAQWMNGSTRGFASYKVGAGVTSHEAWGLGIYCFFSANPSVKLQSAIEAPGGGGVKFHDTVTVALGGKGEITHIVNGSGGAVNSGSGTAHLGLFP
jgi:hypothetical protein